MRTRRLGGALAAFVTIGLPVALAGCGGGSGSPSSPSGTPPGSGGTSTTIAIVGISGAQAFNPDPANIANGATFVWQNNTGTTHHIVFDDGSMDSGNLAPGATSAVLTLRSTTAKYHCTIHPSMVGAINTAVPNPPPCQGAYCDSAK